jgi:hypothetical protein
MIESNLVNELETELGKELFNKVYKVLSDNLNNNIIFFEIEDIKNKIKKECTCFEEISVDLSLTRIPDIYCLIIKERERKIDQ